MGMCMLSNSNVLGESDYCFAFVKDYHHGKYVLDCPKPLWNSDVLGWASSPEPAELSLFNPEPSRALTRACNGLGPGFRFQKPEPRAQAQALIH